MAFDEGLVERIRAVTGADPLMSERKMFGGLCFMSGGKMCFGVLGDEIMVQSRCGRLPRSPPTATRTGNGLHETVDAQHGLRRSPMGSPKMPI